jgi:acyl-CoA synthetase (AMP-forming)/AMP-acid ligase II
VSTPDLAAAEPAFDEIALGESAAELHAPPKSLIDILRRRARRQPQRPVYTFLPDGEGEGASLTFAELERQARGVAALLRQHCGPGERALLCYQPGLEFIAAFFGCLYAGVVAVPAYPPHPLQLQRTLPKLRAIVNDAGARVALTTSDILSTADRIFAAAPQLKDLKWLASDRLSGEAAAGWGQPESGPELGPETLAFLQYTSGSTAAPKGVMLTHANLLHNSEVLVETFKLTPESVLVSWVPTVHDLGLVYGTIQPLYTGFRCYLMPPAAFLQRPMRWLSAMSRYRATHTMAPNFAYDLCARKSTAEQRATLDLGSWQVATNGGESVPRETLERFTDTFAPCGFRHRVHHPSWGLAEATMHVTGARQSDEIVVRTVEAAALERQRVVLAQPGAPNARAFVSCGRPVLGMEVVIVNPETLRRSEAEEVGEIWVAGPSVAGGYWQRPEETRETFAAMRADDPGVAYLRTGDLGFVIDGELFVAGRRKDLIIVGGSNHYPQDIELTVAKSHAALGPDGCAAFSVEVAGAEQLVVAAEVQPEQMTVGEGGVDAGEVVAAVRRAIAEEHEMQVYRVILLKPGAVPKTAVGKVQRKACRQKFLDESLDVWPG